MNNDTLVLAGFGLAMGLAIALVAWWFSNAAARVPDEDREYRDPPPLGFRLIWLPIHWLSFYLEPAIPQKLQAEVLAKLRKSGLDYAVRPVQFMAARVLCGVVMAGLFYWLLGSFDQARHDAAPITSATYFQACLVGALFGWIYPGIWLRDSIQNRRRELLKSLPFYLDIVTLCVEAGLNLQGAVHQAVLKGPKGVVRDEFQRVLRDVRAGKPRAEALRAMAQRVSEAPMTSFVSSVIQAEQLGMSLGPVLRAQADQQRVERFQRAEKLAMEAPVKMLFPLIAFIFPCTFIVLFFPIVVKFMEIGI
ncbi:MAG: type II secretion system F family protein [Rhodocyclales bacterium]|nr:type II secretion system F family protein [Rhodocyclales bacterium]